MISRSPKDCEPNYATNESELLAIVWAIGKLHNYLYGTKELRIFTNIKRWNPFIDENNGKVFYMPGRQNLIADDLYQQPLNNLEAEAQSDAAIVHSELFL